MVIIFSQLLVFLLFGLLYVVAVNKKSENSIRAAFLMMALLFAIEFLYNFSQTYLITIVDTAIIFTQGPILYWLVRSLTLQNKAPISYLHFLPVFLCLAVVLVPFPSQFEPDILDITYSILCISKALYSTVAIVMLYREKDYILDTPQKGWLFILVTWVALLSYVITGFMLAYVLRVRIFELPWEPLGVLPIINTLNAAVGLLLVWWPLNYNDVYVAPNKKPAVTAFDKDVFSRLRALFSNKEIYKDEDVNLSGIADLLAVTPRELSGAVNRVAHITFPMFVRGYRVSAAKKMLSGKDFASKSITEIGLDAGFTNKSTFNASFKTVTGLTPSDFRTSSVSENAN